MAGSCVAFQLEDTTDVVAMVFAVRAEAERGT
jgi:hypothetical protein